MPWEPSAMLARVMMLTLCLFAAVVRADEVTVVEESVPTEDAPSIPPEGTGQDPVTMDAQVTGEAEPSIAGFATRSLSEYRRWKGDISFGLNGAAGNTERFNSRFGLDTAREGKWTDFKNNVTYANSTANGSTTEDKFLHNSRTEWKLGESKWKPYSSVQGVHDIFQEYEYRLILNAGTAYQIWKNDRIDGQVRFGSGATRDFGGESANTWTPEASLGGDWKLQANAQNSFTAGFDYFPSYLAIDDFRLNTRGAWEILVEPRWQLSLRLGFMDRYQTQSYGKKKNDIDYFAEIVKKFGPKPDTK
ncbi:DUF481 domain-containing protein [bacterium]|nr:DUF481 domain-containing protein [bacterium]